MYNMYAFANCVNVLFHLCMHTRIDACICTFIIIETKSSKLLTINIFSIQ